MGTGFKYSYNDAFSFDTVQNFIQIGMAIKADHGGLILGRSHAEGGIYCLFRDGDQYLLQAEVEGFEFVLNQGAAHYCNKFFHILNNYEEHSLLFNFKDYEPHKQIKTLDANLFIDAKFLIFEETSMTLVNKYSAKGFLKTLNEINNAISYSVTGPGTGKIKHRTYDPIDIFFFDEYIGRIPMR